MRQLLAFTACCVVAGGLLWEPTNSCGTLLERKQALHSLSLGLGSVSSAVVPCSFVLKRCSLKANALSLSEEFR